MSEVNLPEWVKNAQNEQELQFRQAIHTIVSAMASDDELAEMSYMKGGILLALRYHSPRYTTDIDFSTPVGYSKAEEAKVLGRLTAGLAEAVEKLEYELDCRIQSAKAEPRPREEFTHLWINLKIGIGYARRGTNDHKGLARGNSRHVIQMDYSFDERVPTQDVFQVDSDGCLRVYALTTLIAEKYRALLQQVIRRRARRQDVYDLQFLLSSFDLNTDAHRREILDVLRVKAEDREVPLARDAMANQEVVDRAQEEYASLVNELVEGGLPDFDESYVLIRTYYENLPWE